MLVKAWFTNIAVAQTNKNERYNGEDLHILRLQASIKQKGVKVHDMHSVDLPWCCATLRADVECMHSLDCDMQANEINKDNLFRARVLAM